MNTLLISGFLIFRMVSCKFAQNRRPAICIKLDALAKPLHSGVGESIPLVSVPSVRIGLAFKRWIDVQTLKFLSRSYQQRRQSLDVFYWTCHANTATKCLLLQACSAPIFSTLERIAAQIDA
jgi:hypothetical protein